MSEKAIDNFVDLLFNFDTKELENETKFLENYKKLQQVNAQLKSVIKEIREYIERFDFEFLHQCCEHNLVEALENLLQILDKGDKWSSFLFCNFSTLLI